MHREVGSALFERSLELLDEQAFATDFRQRAIEDLVAARGHAEQPRIECAMLAHQRAHMLGLPQRETAFARGDHGLLRHG